jgi:hypothetical protein
MRWYPWLGAQSATELGNTYSPMGHSLQIRSAIAWL